MKVLGILAFGSIFSYSIAANINITSPIVTNWGEWGRFQVCPWGRGAQGFQLKTEPNQYLGDDTALNAVKLFCGDPFRPDTAVISGTEGQFGEWGNVYSCYPGYLNGFQFRSESNRNSGDDTAANNIRFFCSKFTDPNQYVEGDGMSWGDWTQAQHCYSGQGICGIQTQIEPYRADDGDDTMLNNVRMQCCDGAGYFQTTESPITWENYPPPVVSAEQADILRFAVATELAKNSTEAGSFPSIQEILANIGKTSRKSAKVAVAH